MRYLVTGATGFIGGALARRLLEAGHEVHVIARDPTRVTGLAGAHCHRGDIGDKASLIGPMTGMDGVFHVAGWYKVGVPDETAAVRTNVIGTRNVLEAMQDRGVPRGVYTSTLAVNSDTHGRVVDESYEFRGRHLSLYDRTKAEAHRVAHEWADAGLPLTIVQPGLVYGPGDTSSIGTMFRRFLRRTLPPVPTGTAFCWAHVADIVEGHILAMTGGKVGRSYFLAGPVHTLVDALALATGITGIPGPRHISPGVLRLGAHVASAVERVVRLPPEFTAEGLRVLAGTTYLGSGARAAAELQWRPRPLREGLQETLDHERRELDREGASR